MVLINNIIVGWSIRGVTKINLIVTRLYEVTKGNITEFDMGRRLMGCFCVTQNGDLGWFRQFIPNNLLLLRQPIPPLLRHYWETWSLLWGLCLNNINRWVYVKWNLITIIRQLCKIIDTPPGFRAKLSVLLEFFVVGRCSQDKEFRILITRQSGTCLCFKVVSLIFDILWGWNRVNGILQNSLFLNPREMI